MLCNKSFATCIKTSMQIRKITTSLASCPQEVPTNKMSPLVLAMQPDDINSVDMSGKV